MRRRPALNTYRLFISTVAVFYFILCGLAQSQPIPDYTILKTPGKIVIDGKLNEPGWQNIQFTSPFVLHTDGSAPVYQTKAKMLWDKKYLYIAFVMDDPDVWAKTKVWTDGPNKCLCREEVAEVFIDPDGDGSKYLEAEINPYGAVMDLWLEKEFKKGGKGDLAWSYKGLKIGITVQGTLNDSTDVDTGWICEMAFPFKDIAPTAPSLHFPPKPGESWRLNLYRYDYLRTPENKSELSAWSQTDKERGFHAPDRFGKVVFSGKKADKK
jgi:hypothetical protein